MKEKKKAPRRQKWQILEHLFLKLKLSNHLLLFVILQIQKVRFSIQIFPLNFIFHFKIFEFLNRIELFLIFSR